MVKDNASRFREFDCGFDNELVAVSELREIVILGSACDRADGTHTGGRDIDPSGSEDSHRRFITVRVVPSIVDVAVRIGVIEPHRALIEECLARDADAVCFERPQWVTV